MQIFLYLVFPTHCNNSSQEIGGVDQNGPMPNEIRVDTCHFVI